MEFVSFDINRSSKSEKKKTTKVLAWIQSYPLANGNGSRFK